MWRCSSRFVNKIYDEMMRFSLLGLESMILWWSSCEVEGVRQVLFNRESGWIAYRLRRSLLDLVLWPFCRGLDWSWPKLNRMGQMGMEAFTLGMLQLYGLEYSYGSFGKFCIQFASSCVLCSKINTFSFCLFLKCFSLILGCGKNCMKLSHATDFYVAWCSMQYYLES